MSKGRKPSGDVRFIKPPNKLKQKAGTGGIDEKLLDKAQSYIEKSELDFTPFAQRYLAELAKYAREARQSNDNFATAKNRLIGPVMQLKAHGGMFKYQLLSDVADIALQFLESIESMDEDAFKVINAHENTIKIIITNKLTGNGGREGYALVKELDKACQRYFKKHRPGD